MIDSIIKKSKGRCEGNLYLYVKNKDGKIWILPIHNLKTALALYEPSSAKGHFLQKGLPYVKYLAPFLGKFGIKRDNYVVSSAFKEKLQNVFPKKNMEYAFFLGTPGSHQKMTVQIFSGNEIIGYCKVSSNPEIVNIFKKEKEVLDYLMEKEIGNIPKCLFCGKYDEENYIFVQSTCKKRKSPTYHCIQEQHIIFLNNLRRHTEIQCDFLETDYYRTLCSFEKNLVNFPNEINSYKIKCIINEIQNYLKTVRTYSFYHGDFTPWNTFLIHDDIYAFDFEYAKTTYPPMIDVFHFFTQIHIYETKETVDAIFEEFKCLFIEGRYRDLFPFPTLFYMMYLIDIIELYLERDKDTISEETRKNQIIRYELLIHCYELHKSIAF